MSFTPDRRDEQYDAFFDPSTGLPTEPLLLDRIDIAIRRARRIGKTALIAQLEVDIPNGDESLARGVAVQLASALRTDDTIARISSTRCTAVSPSRVSRPSSSLASALCSGTPHTTPRNSSRTHVGPVIADDQRPFTAWPHSSQ